MQIKNKEKSISLRLSEKNYQKLVKKAIEKSQKEQHITSITDIVTGLIEKMR